MIIFAKNIVMPEVKRPDNEGGISYAYNENRGQRAIGVVYNPVYERYGNYVSTTLTSRYDVLLFIDNITALSPLHIEQSKDKDMPKTFPSGE
jgi:hypothetical protein